MRRANVQKELTLKKKVLSESDPLFGVLQESQVGINPANGRPCIEEEVLAEMRRYLLANTGEDLALKLDKVIRSIFIKLNRPPSLISTVDVLVYLLNGSAWQKNIQYPYKNNTSSISWNFLRVKTSTLRLITMYKYF